MKGNIFKRITSLILITVLVFTSVNITELSKVRAATTDVKKLSIADGNIWITDTGYIQTTASSTSGITETPWNGTYTLWGVNTSGYTVNVGTDDHEVTLWRLTTNGDINFTALNGSATCRISDKVTLAGGNIKFTNGCSLTVIGGGKNSTTDYLEFSKNGTDLSYIDNLPYNKVTESFTMKDLNVKVSWANTSSGMWLMYFLTSSTSYINNVNIENCNFSNNNSGIVVLLNQDNGYSKNVNITNVDANLDTVNEFIELDGGANSTLRMTNVNLTTRNIGKIVNQFRNVYLDNFNAVATSNGDSRSNVLFLQADYNTSIFNMKNSYINVTLPSADISRRIYVFDNMFSGSQYVFENSTIINSNHKLFDTSNYPIMVGRPGVTTPVTFNRSSIYGDTALYPNLTTAVSPYGDKLYLYSLKVGNTPYQKYDVALTSARDEYMGQSAQLYSDDKGYLRLYLTEGNASIVAKQLDGDLQYTADVTVTTTPSVNISTGVEGKTPGVITTPFKSNSIKWSYDNETWNDASTNNNGQFSLSIPEIGTLYVIPEDGLLYAAPITNQSIGTFNQVLPTIKDQSISPLKVVKGKVSTLYINAEPTIKGNTFSYKWYKDGVVIDSQTDSVLNIPNITDTDIASYYCEVTESNGTTINSDLITLEYDDTVGDTTTLKNKIIELENQIADLDNQIINITDQLTNTNTALTGLQDANTDLTNLLDAANKSISTLTTDKSNIENQLATVTNELNSAKETLSLLENDNENQDTIIANLNTSITNLESTVDQLTSEKNNLQVNVNNLTSFVDDIKQALGVTSNDDILPAIETLKSKITELTNANQSLSDALNIANQDIISWKNKLDALQTENNINDAELEAAYNQITNLENIKVSLESQISNMQTAINDLNSKITDLTDKYNANQITISDMQNTIIDLNSNIYNLNNEKTTLQTDIDSLNSQINSLETVLQKIRDELGVGDNGSIIDAIKQLKDTISIKNTESQILKDQINTIEADLSNEKAKNEALNTTLDNLKSLVGTDNNDDIQAEIIDIQEQLKNSDDVIDTLTTEKNTLSNQVNTLIQKNQELTDRIKELDELLIQSQIDLQNKIDVLKQQVNILENDKAALVSSVNTLQNEVSNLNDINTDLQSQISNLQSLLDGANSTIIQLKDALSIKETEIQSLKDRISDIESNLNNEQAKNEALNNTLTNLKSLVGTDNNDDIQAKIIDIQEQLKKSNDVIDTLTTEKNTLSNQVNTLIQKNQELNDRVKDLDNLLNQNQADFQNKIDNLNQQLKSLDDDKTALENSVNNLENQVSDLNDVNTDLQSQINKLQSLLDSANLTIEQLREELSNTYAENQSLKNENETLKTATLNYQNKLKELQNIIDIYNSDNNSSITELQNKISELESALNDSQVESVKKDSIIDEANKKIKDFIDLVAKLQDQLNNTQNAPSNSAQQSEDTNIPVSEDTTITVSKSVSETVIIPDTSSNTVVAKDGWELSTDPYSGEWDTTIDNSTSEGIYSFFTKGTAASLMSNGKRLKKKIIYARNKSNEDVIYVCSYDPSVKNDPNQIVTSFKCNNKNVVLAESEKNTYDVDVKGKLIFTVGADFGNLSKKEILYQLVPEKEDFDPDGNWVELEGNTITITGLAEPSRLYIKYIDSNDNFVVDKTIGFKPGTTISKEIPKITMNKVIYKGKTFNLKFNNLNKATKMAFTSKNSKIAYVNKQGEIQARKIGTTKIYCDMYVDGVKKSTVIINVTVKKVVDDEFNYNLVRFQSSLTADDTVIVYKRIETGKTTTFKLNNYDNVSYISSNSSIATVNDKGVIKAKKKGSATITILGYKDKKIYSYQIVVRVDDGTKDNEKSSYLK